MEPFPALVVRERDGRAAAELEYLKEEDLPPADVTVRVEYSSLNYKDGLGVSGKGKIFRSLPMVPGIDLAGSVLSSSDPRFAPGDRVLATGGNLGERFFGGYSRYARVASSALVPIPAVFDARQAMAIGTAGVTAALARLLIERAGVSPDPGSKEVVVTGAGGGVGSFAVLLLAKAGFRVAASTGRPELASYLEELGASRIVTRAELARAPKPLEAGVWAGAIDNVGGDTLATLLAQTARHGVVAACGLVGSSDLKTTVMPFILRGVQLLGVDSNECAREDRLRAWEILAKDVPPALVDTISEEIALADIADASARILAGKVRGRIVVKIP